MWTRRNISPRWNKAVHERRRADGETRCPRAAFCCARPLRAAFGSPHARDTLNAGPFYDILYLACSMRTGLLRNEKTGEDCSCL